MAHNAKYTPQNLLLIKGWTHDEKDRELVRMLPFLKYLATNRDVRSVPEHQQLFEEHDCLRVNSLIGEVVHMCRSKLIRKTAEKINFALLKRWENSSDESSLWSSPEHHQWVYDETFYLDKAAQYPRLKSPTSLWESDMMDLKDSRIEVQRAILDEYLTATKEANNLCF